MAGKACTSESDPRCQSSGATAAATPGTSRTFAAISSAFPFFSTRMSNGFITPGLMPAAAS